MLLINSDPSEPYVPFVSNTRAPWWAYEIRRREVRVGGFRRFLGRALIRAGRAVAAEHHAPALG